MKLPHPILALATLHVLLLSACGGSDAGAQPEPPPGYIQARQAWLTAPPQNYRFTLATTCEGCPPGNTVWVLVQAGQVMGAFDAQTGLALPAGDAAALPSMTGLFDLADAAYAGAAEGVEVQVAPGENHLAFLTIDPKRSLLGDGRSYQVSGLAVQSQPWVRLTVAKSMNAVQCQSEGLSLAALQAELGASAWPVLGAACGVDGLLYPAVCGAGNDRIGIFDVLSGSPAAELPAGFVPISAWPDAKPIPCP